jgi:hypothetical protein
LERDALALALLQQSPVGFAPAEKILSRASHWLFLLGLCRDHPEFTAALKTQIDLNRGAWPFSEAEKAALSADEQNGAMIAAYLPNRLSRNRTAALRTVSMAQSVKAHYEKWPYPPWCDWQTLSGR